MRDTFDGELAGVGFAQLIAHTVQRERACPVARRDAVGLVEVHLQGTLSRSHGGGECLGIERRTRAELEVVIGAAE